MTDRTNEEWIADLKADGDQKEAALADLRAAIATGLPYALSNYLTPDNPQFGSLAEEVTQDTLLRVLDHLDSFEGRSRFTTWVQKIAVRIALTELRRRRWRDFSLDSLVEENEELVATAIEGVPLEEVARRMDMKRNALYKLLHDARLRLKKRLANEGLTTEDVWAAFDRG